MRTREREIQEIKDEIANLKDRIDNLPEEKKEETPIRGAIYEETLPGRLTWGVFTDHQFGKPVMYTGDGQYIYLECSDFGGFYGEKKEKHFLENFTYAAATVKEYYSAK